MSDPTTMPDEYWNAPTPPVAPLIPAPEQELVWPKSAGSDRIPSPPVAEPVCEVLVSGVRVGMNANPDQLARLLKMNGQPLYAHTPAAEPVAEMEPVAWIEHHKGGDNLSWEPLHHPYAKATPLVRYDQAAARIAAAEQAEKEADEAFVRAMKRAEKAEAALQSERAARMDAERDAARYRDGLLWYADGHHIELPDWDSCSGESQNWLFPPTDDSWMVDDGSVAKAVIEGAFVNPNHEEGDHITFVRPTNTEENERLLARVAEIMPSDPEPDSKEGKELILLATIIEEYEKAALAQPPRSEG